MSKSNNVAYLRAQKANDFWGTIRRLVRYMSTRFWALLATFIFASSAAVLNALSPHIVGKATTVIYEGLKEGQAMKAAGQVIERYPIDFEAIKHIGWILFWMFIIRSILRYLQGYITGIVAQRTVYDLRKDLKEKMARLPVEYFDTHSTGDIMSRAVNDMDQIASTLQQSLAQFIIAIVMFISVLAIMLWVDWRMSLIVIASVLFSLFLIMNAASRSQRQFIAQQREIGSINDSVEEIFSGHTVVRTNNREKEEFEKFIKKNHTLYNASWKAQFLSGIMMPLVNFSRDLGYFGIALYGGFGVIQGTIPLGVVQAFMQYVNQFSQPVRQVAQLANNIQVTVAACERVFEILDEPEMEVTLKAEPSRPDASSIIEFDNVQFGYDDNPDAELLMTHFNLKVYPGQMVAIVGPTGAGKSTLINLLERFYDVKGGAIFYKGEDIRSIPREQLREKFSMVLQDTWLFNGTIWDNIAYGNEQATEEEVLRASKAAYVHDFVCRLPEGYRTILNEEGTNISQGQKQLITIARAFIANPEILILDEATSSVDTRTEVHIQKAMKNVLKGRTSFVVAHRLSTIRDADLIVVMNNGDVMETGNHEQLMAQQGFYASLYQAQFATT
ncbi:ABC transporter ATP-binding protein [Allofustis seminis]|uniref:ABC transporter ATP-binding protein n=1 Tax=Allofustis seminis TaxID=166939 RepID=UPI0003791C1B|nr:ABC transporter ATP-binding protein [Allofustis seminis]